MSERDPLQPTSSSQREALEEAAATYEQAVGVEVARYLLGRGLTEETVRTFRLGVVADPLPGHERYRGWLAIPYLTGRDRHPVSMRFRCLNDHRCRDHGHGKYLSMPDEPSRVFNLPAVFDATDTIHVTEGEFDAMVLTQVGLPAVAIPGASGWAFHHRPLLAGFSRVWVWGDPDDAGADFVQKVCRSLRSAKGVRIKGGDVSEVYQQGGASALLELIEGN